MLRRTGGFMLIAVCDGATLQCRSKFTFAAYSNRCKVVVLHWDHVISSKNRTATSSRFWDYRSLCFPSCHVSVMLNRRTFFCGCVGLESKTRWFGFWTGRMEETRAASHTQISQSRFALTPYPLLLHCRLYRTYLKGPDRSYPSVGFYKPLCRRSGPPNSRWDLT